MFLKSPAAVPLVKAGLPSNVPNTLGVNSSTFSKLEANSGFLLYSNHKHTEKKQILLSFTHQKILKSDIIIIIKIFLMALSEKL